MNTVLHETLSKQGALFASHPSGPGVESFGDPAREAAAALAGCVIAPRSLPGRVVVRGKDHRDLLHRISTNEINALKAGDGCLTVFLDPRGRIIDLVQALADEDSVLLITSAGNGRRIHDWIDSFIFREEVTLEESSDHELFGIFGAGAGSILERLTGLSRLEDLKTGWHREAVLNQSKLRIVRTFPLAGSGFLILTPPASATALWDSLVGAGAVPAGDQAVERLRVDAGVPGLGHELSEDFNPWEAALDRAISLTKGCYTGQEVVARLNTYKKVQRRLAGLAIDGQEIPVTGSRVFQALRPTGQVTSSDLSPRDGKPIALAFLTLPHPPLGARVEVDSGGTRITARTRALPFLK